MPSESQSPFGLGGPSDSLRHHGGRDRREDAVSIAFRLGWSLRRARQGGHRQWQSSSSSSQSPFGLGGPSDLRLASVRQSLRCATVRLNRLSAWVVPPTRSSNKFVNHLYSGVSIAFRLGWSLRPLNRIDPAQAASADRSQSPFGLGGPSDARVSIAVITRLCRSQSPFGLGGPSDYVAGQTTPDEFLAAVSIAFRLGWSLRPAWNRPKWHVPRTCLNRLSAWVVPPTPEPGHYRDGQGGSLNRLSAWVVPPTDNGGSGGPRVRVVSVSIAFRLGWSLRLVRRYKGASEVILSQSPFGLGGPSDRRCGSEAHAA